MSTACSLKPAITARPKVVSVNGVTIPREAIAQETQNHPAPTPLEAWRAAARALVVRELLAQEAARLGIAAEPMEDGEGRRETGEEARIRALVEREVVTPEPGEAECRRYYDQNRRRFRTPDLFEASHILLPVRSDAEKASVAATASALLAALAGDPDSFAALARVHSACPSAEVGGSLGQIGLGQTVPEFEKALLRMAPGRVHPEPVSTRYGLHIVRLERRIEGRPLPFKAVAPRVAAYLRERVQRTAQRQYVSLLAGRAAIAGVEIEAASSPLMQ